MFRCGTSGAMALSQGWATAPILHTKQALFTSRQQKHGEASKFFGVMFTVCKHFPRPCCLAAHSHCHHPSIPTSIPTMHTILAYLLAYLPCLADHSHCHHPTMPPPLAQGRPWPGWRWRATKKKGGGFIASLSSLYSSTMELADWPFGSVV